MEGKQILFTDIKKAEVVMRNVDDPIKNEVLVEIAYSAISNGTEKANLLYQTNLGVEAKEGEQRPWPRALGYSAAGKVVSFGEDVKDLSVGQNVVVCWGQHSRYAKVTRNNIIPIPDGVDLKEAAMAPIASFPMAALRKTKLEIGESAIVMGQGMLGIFAVMFYAAAGATPVIAVDPVESRRNLALQFGADYALDPNDPKFIETVKELTNGGVNCAIEVTGVGEAFNEVLDVMAKMGRIALLGCTRNSDFSVDYYHKIHGPGITIVGAHTFARPENDSYPGFWTQADDVAAILRLIKANKVDFKNLISEVHKPIDAPEVYVRLCEDRNFPLGVIFDWN